MILLAVSYLWIIYRVLSKQSSFWRGRDIVLCSVLFVLIAANVLVRILEVVLA